MAVATLPLQLGSRAALGFIRGIRQTFSLKAGQSKAAAAAAVAVLVEIQTTIAVEVAAAVLALTLAPAALGQEMAKKESLAH
jgi:hypothetical protein